MFNFKNDYSVGAHPKVLEAIHALNMEGNVGYGEDPYCSRAANLIRELCAAPNAAVHFFIGGTSANLTTIAAFLRPWEAAIAPVSGHINVHEGGAVEATGHKILPVPTSDGKLRPADLEQTLSINRGDTAMVYPRLVYISNSTEIGTIYSRKELTELSQFCKANNLYLFLDGARLGCALTSPESDLSLPDLASLCDAFYIGGTKNGALMGEAMVLTQPELHPFFFRMMKQQGAVLAKGFLLGAQFEALLHDGLYWDLARRANRLAQKLQSRLIEKGYPLLQLSPTNQIFPIFPNSQMQKLNEIALFEIWDHPDDSHTTVRFVTSFATKEEDVDNLLASL